MIEKARGDSAEEALRRETLLVVWTASILALLALAYCSRHGMLLLYGDAVAHLHIARRVFDSISPGYRQLGSVWLPLPHILLLPFVLNDAWWRSGLAGAWISIPSYIVGCAGLYRLARIWLPASAAGIAVAFYALNPGLIYMSTTAMTEPLFLAEMIWVTLLVVRYVHTTGGVSQSAPAKEGPGRALPDQAPGQAILEVKRQRQASRFLIAAGLLAVCAIYTRYDGWFFAAAAWLCATWPLARGRFWKRPIGGAWMLFTALLVTAPVAWLAYNAKQFGDPLDFIRGPYSAQAIEARTSPPGSPHYQEYHRPVVSTLYFLKAAELGASPRRLGDLLLSLSIAGTVAALFFLRYAGLWPVLLLWLPVPFYAYSVAYGSVPIFIPIWFPNSWYNTRYGMELLPAFAFFLGCLMGALLCWKPRWKFWTLACGWLLILGNSADLLHAKPLVFQEAVVNSRTRLPFEHALAGALLSAAGRGLILMEVSRDVGAIQQTGIPLRRVINEGDYFAWRRALADPAKAAPTVVAIDGDHVSRAVREHPGGLRLLDVICSTGQPCARVYRSLRYVQPQGVAMGPPT